MKWEYRTVGFSWLPGDWEFASYGEEGWELVSVFPNHGSGYVLFFKRPA